MHRIGAILYAIWGLLHVFAAVQVYKLGSSIEPGMVQGRIFQDSWNLMFFAMSAIVVAVIFNWKNSRLGYWLNLAIVSVGDVGFIVTILLPGYLPLIPGIVGPVLWVLAVVFSTLGMLNGHRDNWWPRFEAPLSAVLRALQRRN